MYIYVTLCYTTTHCKQSLLKKALVERHELLCDSFQEIRGEFSFAHGITAASAEEIQTFLDKSIKNNCEGLMVKIYEGPESIYEPSKRSKNWLKVIYI